MWWIKMYEDMVVIPLFVYLPEMKFFFLHNPFLESMIFMTLFPQENVSPLHLAEGLNIFLGPFSKDLSVSPWLFPKVQSVLS